MKIVIKENNIKNYTNWVMPSYDEEKEEFQRYSFTDEEINKIKESFKPANIIQLDQSIWSNLKNTDSWDTSEIQQAVQLSKEYDKDYKSIVRAFKTGKALPCPIILKQNGEYELIAGNTRLMFARALGITPKVLMIKI